jgi:hypothetical protein
MSVNQNACSDEWPSVAGSVRLLKLEEIENVGSEVVRAVTVKNNTVVY